MKLAWQTAFKAFIALFWVANISMLLYGAMSSSKGIENHLLSDVMSQFFLIIGILGILSVIAEIFYKNIIYKYFVLSFLLVSYFFFFEITFQFFNIKSSFSKAMDLSNIELHYTINFILIILSTLGIYGLLKNNKKIIYFGFLCSLMYLILYILFYALIRWNH